MASRSASRSRPLPLPGEETGHARIVLGVLSAVDRDSGVTQRRLASELGIALGLANACLKRCVRKGLIKVGQAPLNRYAYYLTPHGFAEKSRLTVQFLAASFDFFRNARQQCAEIFEACRLRDQRRLALVGISELAEVAVLSAAESEIELIAVIDGGSGAARCAGLQVVASLQDAFALAPGGGLDALIVTDLRGPQATFDRLLWSAGEMGIAPERVYCPPLLSVRRSPPLFPPQETEPAR